MCVYRDAVVGCVYVCGGRIPESPETGGSILNEQPQGPCPQGPRVVSPDLTAFLVEPFQEASFTLSENWTSSLCVPVMSV